MHIKALEGRIAELETTLAQNGLSEQAVDHWSHNREGSNGTEVSDKPEDFSLAAVRDVSLNISGPFIGGTSTITLARMLESILGKGKDQSGIPATTYATTTPNDTAAEATTEDIPSMDPELRSPMGSSIGNGLFPNIINGLPGQIADKLLEAFINSVAANFPVVHSGQIRKFHRDRDTLDDPYEESMLNLVYALGGQYLEAVGFVVCGQTSKAGRPGVTVMG